MKICAKCGKEFPSVIEIDGIRRNLKSRKHCIDCVPFGIKPSNRARLRQHAYGNCLCCGAPLKAKGKKYCNNQCQRDYEYKEFIVKWKKGEVSGTTGDAWIDTSGYIRRYIFEKFDNKCAECGWSKINPFTGTLPLEIEHIDGDSTNNKEENLTLLCPNCHSLTRTYRGANKGHGTRDIKWISRGGLTTNVDN